jgi:photosystem II stability/assembly factor-like uncharacterized protein
VGGGEGMDDRILWTEDGGTTWREVTPPEPAGQEGGPARRALAAFSGQAAWVVYFTGGPPVPAERVVWRTGDGGRTWAASRPLDTHELMDIFDPSHLVLVDDQHLWLLVHLGAGMNHDYIAIYRSQDGGQSWERIVDPFGPNLIQSCAKTGLLFVSPDEGWLTGDCHGVAPGVLLYRSSDGGLLWEAVDLPEPPGQHGLFESFDIGCGSYSPAFSNPMAGGLLVNCTAFGLETPRIDTYRYSTADGGQNWSVEAFPVSHQFWLDAQTGWGLGGEIYQTRDGGQSWERLHQVSWDGQFDFVTPFLGWAVARAAGEIALVVTEDGGRSWAILEPRIAP